MRQENCFRLKESLCYLTRPCIKHSMCVDSVLGPQGPLVHSACIPSVQWHSACVKSGIEPLFLQLTLGSKAGRLDAEMLSKVVTAFSWQQ